MTDFLQFPIITANEPEKQIAQINNYLIQLKESLEFAFMGLSSENQSVANSLAKSLANANETREDQIQQVSSKVTSNADNISSSIEQTADEIRTEVSQTLEAYSTTKEMNSAITQSKDEINLSVSETLKSYSTTEEMNSAISQKAGEAEDSANASTDISLLVFLWVKDST